MIDQRIEDKLRALGLTAVYEGYFCLIHAVQLAEEDPTRLNLPTKLLYPDVARLCGISAGQVDGTLRCAIRRCCRSNADAVALMCGTQEEPTVVQFIGGLVSLFQEGSER